MKTRESIRVSGGSDRLNPELQISIHGADGSLSTFTQDEPALVQRIIKESQRPEFFAQGRIILAGQFSLTTFVVSNIARIDLAGEGISAWKPKPSSEAPDLVEISQQEFLGEAEDRELQHVERPKRQHAPGQQFVGYLDIQMVNGRHVYLKFHGVAALPAERLQRVHSFLTLPSLSFRMPGGGRGILNLSKAAKFTACPGPAEVPADAWVAKEKQTRQE